MFKFHYHSSVRQPEEICKCQLPIIITEKKPDVGDVTTEAKITDTDVEVTVFRAEVTAKVTGTKITDTEVELTVGRAEVTGTKITDTEVEDTGAEFTNYMYTGTILLSSCPPKSAKRKMPVPMRKPGFGKKTAHEMFFKWPLNVIMFLQSFFNRTRVISSPFSVTTTTGIRAQTTWPVLMSENVLVLQKKA